MSNTQKTGLISRVTEAALQGQQPTAADFIELAKLLDANSVSTSKAVTEFHSRISELELQVKALNEQLSAKTSEGEPAQAEAANDDNFAPCDRVADAVTALLVASSFQRSVVPFMGMPAAILIKTN